MEKRENIYNMIKTVLFPTFEFLYILSKQWPVLSSSFLSVPGDHGLARFNIQHIP